nr:hypothetical protein [Pedococcus badiiscoriae]
MAYRLARSHIDRLLHVHGLGWHVWDGQRWAVDDAGHARRAVLDVLSEALAESVGDKQLRADVARCESAAGVNGVLDIASALVEFAATVRDLDADPPPIQLRQWHTRSTSPRAASARPARPAHEGHTGRIRLRRRHQRLGWVPGLGVARR